MIPYLDKTIVKISLVVALVCALLGFYQWHYTKIFNSGADSVRAELADEYKKREKKLNEDLSAAIEKNKEHKTESSKLQSDLRKQQIENRKLSNEISKADFQCDSLGVDFNYLWNKTIGERPKLD